MVINNLIYNPGPRAVHYNLIAEEWRGQPYQVGQMALIGNVLRGGPSTPPGLALFMLGGSGDIELYEDDNIAVDWVGRPLEKLGRYTTSSARIVPIARPSLPFNVKLLRAADVQDAVIRNAGARPWDRDPIDARIVADTIEGRGEIIDNQAQVGGYPQYKETRAGVQGEGMGSAVHDEEGQVANVTCPPADTRRSPRALRRRPARCPRPRLRA